MLRFSFRHTEDNLIHGGSAKDSVEQIASHVRDYHPPEIYEEHLGFRLVMELE